MRAHGLLSRPSGSVLSIVVLLGCLMLAGCLGDDNDTAPPATPSTEPVFTPILSRIMAEPVAVRGSDRHWHLVYELELRNITPGNAVIERVDVRDPDRDQPLATFSGSEIAERLQTGGVGASTTQLGAAQFGVLYLHLRFPDQSAVPLALEHRVSAAFDAAPPGQEQSTSAGDIGNVLLPPPVVLGPPLRGSGYIAADGCCQATRHIRALLPLNGSFRLSQRFAIDWEQLDEQNRLFVGPREDLESYHIYGREALAVADAAVVVAVDGLPDITPGALPDSINPAEADGNHVILDLGNGAYVLYAHLQPGSVRVAVGNVVRRGQVLGLVGNSGNTLAPHLHLHIMDAPSGLVANGLPYVFDRYRITGIDLAGTDDFDHAEATGEPATITPINPPSQHENELPLDLTVVYWLND